MPFASVPYFEAWLSAFGGQGSGIWTLDGPPGRTSIAYVRDCVSLGPFRIVAVRSATNDHTPRFDVVGELGDPARALCAIQKALGASLIVFDYLSTNSRLLRTIRSGGDGLWHQIEFCEESPYVDCRSPWDTYWESRGTTRHLWARRERKLISDLSARFRFITDWDQVAPLLPAVFEVESSGWKGRTQSAIGQNAATLAFYGRCLRHWAECGWLRLYLLELGEDIIAFQITVLYEGVLYQLKVGYQEQHAKLSPGQVLQLQLLRDAFADPAIHAYDMLGGGGKAAANKRKWATSAETLYTLRVFRRNIGGMLAWCRFVVAPRVKAAILARLAHSPAAEASLPEEAKPLPPGTS